MHSLLVPLDGSSYSERALPTALGIARRTSARVTLVAVHEPPVPPFGAHGAPVYDSRFDNDRRAEVRQQLEAVRHRAQASTRGLEVEALVLDGSPADTIERYAATHGPSLVVLASHGSGGPNKSWLGSVTDRLVRRLPMPVVVVRVPEVASEGEVEEPGIFRRVLVTLDGSEESEAAMGHAVAVAGNAEAEFTLLRVVAPRNPMLGNVATPGELASDMGEHKSVAHTYLEDASARMKSLHPNVRTAVRVDRHPANAIGDFVAEAGIDLIAMATHARGALGRFFLGSVADKVVRTATVPVLLCNLEATAVDQEREAHSAGASRAE